MSLAIRAIRFDKDGFAPSIEESSRTSCLAPAGGPRFALMRNPRTSRTLSRIIANEAAGEIQTMEYLH